MPSPFTFFHLFLYISRLQPIWCHPFVHTDQFGANQLRIVFEMYPNSASDTDCKVSYTPAEIQSLPKKLNFTPRCLSVYT